MTMTTIKFRTMTMTTTIITTTTTKKISNNNNNNDNYNDNNNNIKNDDDKITIQNFRIFLFVSTSWALMKFKFTKILITLFFYCAVSLAVECGASVRKIFSGRWFDPSRGLFSSRKPMFQKWAQPFSFYIEGANWPSDRPRKSIFWYAYQEKNDSFLRFSRFFTAEAVLVAFLAISLTWGENVKRGSSVTPRILGVRFVGMVTLLTLTRGS